jgi:DNA-directed RNA polymerase sigma subunit (sigma70/sigma32)
MSFDKQAFFDYYVANPHISLVKIGEKFGRSDNTLRKILKEYGITRKHQHFAPELEQKVVRLYSELRSIVQVGRKLAMDENTISKILKRNGVKTLGKRCKSKPDLTPEQEQMFIEHQPLVKYLIKKMGAWRARMAGMELEDMLQAGTIGLWRAALTYDKSHGTVFSTHATKAIKGEILAAIEEARFGRRQRGETLIDHSQFVCFEENLDEKQ